MREMVDVMEMRVLGSRSRVGAEASCLVPWHSLMGRCSCLPKLRALPITCLL